MKKIIKLVTLSLVLFIFVGIFPIISYSQATPVPGTPSTQASAPAVGSVAGSAGTGFTYECIEPTAGPNGGPRYGNCTWNNLIEAVQRFFDFLIPFALFFTVVVLTYAGFFYMKSGTNPSDRTKANRMFQNVAIGIFFILAAWLIVKLITNALIGDTTIINNIPL